MDIKIEEIAIKKAVIDAGLAVHLSLKGDPINPYESPLWQKVPHDKPGAYVTNPAAFTAAGLKSLVLEVTLSITGAAPGNYQLNGCDASLDIDQSFPVLSSCRPFEIKKTGTETVFHIDVKPYSLEPFHFRASVGQTDAITWFISPADESRKRERCGQTPLEIYTLYDGADFSFFRRGVPVEILRYLDMVYINLFCRDQNPNCPSAGDDEVKAEAFVEYIVKACFFRNPPRYDIYNGAPHFSSLKPRDDTVTGGIFLGMYLNALSDSDALCNCEDQAAALYAFLSAVGIGNVDICYMNPFGFLKISLLVGREFVNNPIYKGNRENKIVPQRSPGRGSFGFHSFCAWENNKSENKPRETKILDACVGPHTGSENKEQYVSDVIDTVYPASANKPGTPADISQYNVKATVDYIPGPDLTLKPTVDRHYFVVCEWADPRACPVLGFDWNIEYEKTFAGDIEVLKVWKLRKKGESIDIKLYVNSSADTDITKNRFFSIYTSTTHPDEKSPYEKGGSYLGKLSAQSCFQHTRRVFWVPHFESLGLSNVTFDVMSTNTSFNVDALLVWLNQMALTHKARSIGPFTPKMRKLTFTPQKPKVGDRVKISINSNMNIMLDFLLMQDSGLRLIDQGALPTGNSSSILDIHPEMEFYLEFIALKKSKNKVRIIAVDKDTLLCNLAEMNIPIDEAK